MPIFIIYALGQPAHKVRVDHSPVRVGREATNDLVIRDETVSRDHAMFMTDEHGRWVVSCVSETNGLVVDGKLTRSGAQLKEGSQVLFGTEHLVVFSENEITAKDYLGSGGAYARAECKTCHWKGMVSTARNKPKSCPRCGEHEFLGIDRYESGEATQLPLDSPTRMTSVGEVREIWSRLYNAKRSSIERADGRDKLGATVSLQEDTSFEFGSGKHAQFRLVGFLFGTAQLTWSGDYWVLHSQMTFPACRVNGRKITSAQLSNGDLIQIGSNKFKFVVTT